MTTAAIHYLKRNPRSWVAFALPILAISGLAASSPPSDSSSTQTSDHPTITVEVIEVHSESGCSLDRTFTGTVVPKRASDLGFKRTGRVTKIAADQGDRVKQGDVIAELDTASIEAEMNVVRAQRTAAEAKLEELVAGPRTQTIEASKARAEELKALRDQAAMVYERRRKLSGGDAISQQDVDDARLLLAASEGRLVAQKQILAELQEGTRKEQLQAQRAMVAQLDAGLASLQVQIDESRLLAPFDAMIARRMADEGTVVDPGTVVTRLVELASPEVWVGVPPDFVSQLNLEQTHSLTIRGQARKAKVRAVLPELDATTRTQTAVLQLIEDPSSPHDDLFSLGQIAQLHLKQTSTQTGFWLPLSALTQGVRGLWSAFVVQPAEDNQTTHERVIHRVDLEILQIDTDRVLVTGTLQEGDRVVVAGVQKLANGQRVQLAAPEPPKPDSSN